MPPAAAPRLRGGGAAFIWMRDSGPVYTTRPAIRPLFFSVVPRSSIPFMSTGTAATPPACKPTFEARVARAMQAGSDRMFWTNQVHGTSGREHPVRAARKRGCTPSCRR